MYHARAFRCLPCAIYVHGNAQWLPLVLLSAQQSPADARRVPAVRQYILPNALRAKPPRRALNPTLSSPNKNPKPRVRRKNTVYCDSKDGNSAGGLNAAPQRFGRGVLLPASRHSITRRYTRAMVRGVRSLTARATALLLVTLVALLGGHLREAGGFSALLR